MVTLTRLSSGLLKKFDGTLTGWTVDAGWTSVATPGYSVFDPLRTPIVGGNGDPSDYLGCREAHPFREGGVDYLLYDACGLDRIGWVNYIAFSSDGWLTRSKIGPLNFGLSNPAGGSFTGSFLECFMKVGSTYYIMAAATNGGKLAFGPNNYPLASGGAFPYVVWMSSNILGPYTGVIVPNPGVSWATSNFATNCILLIGGVFYNFSSGDVFGVEGLATALSLLGPWVIAGPADQVILRILPFLGSPPRGQEGLSAFLSPTHGIYCGITNSFPFDGTIEGDDSNVVLYGTADPTVWPNARGTRIQSATPMDGSSLAINEGSVVTGPDGALIYDPATGIIPFTYATCSIPTLNGGGGVSPQIRYAVRIAMLEPTSNGMSVAGKLVGGPLVASYPLVHSDLSLEFAFESSADNGTPSLTVNFRSDVTRQNCYSVTFQGSTAQLHKISGGVSTLLASTTGNKMVVTSGLSRPYRVQIVCVGDRTQAYLDGELQIDHVDGSSPIASGVQISLAPHGFDGEARCMSARSGNTVTVLGLAPASTLTVKAPCGYAAGASYGDESGVATFENPHYPMSLVNVSGEDFSPVGGVWGGDVYQASGVVPVASSLESVIGLS